MTSLDTIIARTDGVSAPFLKELLRRAALLSAESSPDGGDSAPLHATDDHLTAALDGLLDSRGLLTRVLLGGIQSPASDLTE